MANKTPIQWTDATSNLIRYINWEGDEVWACSKASAGCAHCYAERIAMRFNRGEAFTKANLKNVRPFFHGKEAEKILRARSLSGKKVFVGDMTDMFGRWISDDLLDRVFAVAALRPDVTFQFLTKHPDRAAEYLSTSGCGDDERRDDVAGAALELRDDLGSRRGQMAFSDEECLIQPDRWPLPNVWLGTSVENQEMANRRIPNLLRCQAAVWWLSIEPMLGPIRIPEDHLRRWRSIHMGLSVRGALRNRSFDGFTHDDGRPMSRAEAEAELYEQLSKGVEVLPMGECPTFDPKTGCPGHRTPSIDWIVVGGESGALHRPFEWAWARELRDQCRENSAAFFMKQGSANKPKDSMIPEDLMVREFPKIAEETSDV